MALLCAASAACAPIQTRTETIDTVLGAETVRGEPQSTFMIAKIDATAAGVALAVSQSSSCEEKQVENVRQSKRRVRTAGRAFLALELAAAAIGLIAGGVVLADAGNVPEEGDPDTTNPLTREQAQGIGVGLLGLGALAAIAGGVDLLRARDRVEGGAVIQRDVEGQSKILTCNESVVANQDVGLIVSRRYVAAGRTDEQGNLAFGWDVVPPELLAGPDWPSQATVAVGPGEPIRALVEGGGQISSEAVGQVSLEHARAAAADAAWLAAQQADTLAAYQEFAASFPEAHVEGAVAAIMERDVEGRARRQTEKAAGLWQLYDDHMQQDSLLQAGSVLADIASENPIDPRIAEAKDALAARKQALADELGAGAKAAVGEGRYADAIALADRALALVPDHSRATRYGATARDKEQKRLLDEAKAATKAGEYARAAELIERAAALAPDASGVARARKELEKRAGAAEASAARDEAKRKQDEEKRAREAEERAAREAAKAERDAARDQKRAEAAEKAAERKRGDHKLEYRVDEGMADDNLIVALRYPPECSAKPRSKRLSKDAFGEKLEMEYSAEVDCETHQFSLVQNKTKLAVECRHRTCAECEENVAFMLAPVAERAKRDGGKLKQAKSCR
jgi:tetratricopeptide (TPR) repeat protein